MHIAARPFNAAIAVAFLTACSTAAQPARTPMPSDVVGTVSGSSITLSDVDERAMQAPAGNFGSLTLMQALYEAAAHGARRDHRQPFTRPGSQSARHRPRDPDRGRSGVENGDADRSGRQRAGIRQTRDACRAPASSRSKSRSGNSSSGSARRPHGSYLDTLRAKTAITIALEPPRVKVAEGGGPTRGPANAPIAIVEFSDFECPYCLPGFSDGDRTVENLRRPYPSGLPSLPASEPPERQAGRRGRRMRQRAGPSSGSITTDCSAVQGNCRPRI